MEFHKALSTPLFLWKIEQLGHRKDQKWGWIPSRMALKGMQLSDTRPLPSFLKFLHPFLQSSEQDFMVGCLESAYSACNYNNHFSGMQLFSFKKKKKKKPSAMLKEKYDSQNLGQHVNQSSLTWSLSSTLAFRILVSCLKWLGKQEEGPQNYCVFVYREKGE